MLFLGTAWPDVLWPFQIGFLGSLAAGIGALLALDREDRRGDVIAAVLLGGRARVSSLGLPLLARGRARGARAARPALALVDRRRAGRALRGWYVGYGGEGTATTDNLFGSPGYVAEAAAGAAGALFSLGQDWGRPLAVGVLVALLLSLHRRGTRRGGCSR